jgi:predicted transposase/invertase (TIGR01784 family)
MKNYHDNWYKRLFSDPHIVRDLLTGFVNEKFVETLDFSSIKKLNSSFVSEEFKNRESDVIYEIKSNGQSTYIYLLIEFQSTVDRFMALRMASYVFQFYQEVQKTTKCTTLQPVFPILIYNGNDKWTAPDNFRKLLAKSEIPTKYLPEFRYYKVAINEIPKRRLVELRNALSAVFYIENSTPKEIEQNHAELIDLLKDVFRYEGSIIVNSIMRWMESVQKISLKPKRIKNIKDIMEVSSMWEASVRQHEQAILKQGIEQGIEVEKQNVLIDQITIKFGKSDSADKKVRKTHNLSKLNNALRKVLFAKTRAEVLECLE